MNRIGIAARITLSASAVVVAAAAPAQSTDTRPMVEWIIPALKSNVPQTAEEAKEGQRSGRKLPIARMKLERVPVPACRGNSMNARLYGRDKDWASRWSGPRAVSISGRLAKSIGEPAPERTS